MRRRREARVVSRPSSILSCPEWLNISHILLPRLHPSPPFINLLAPSSPSVRSAVDVAPSSSDVFLLCLTLLALPSLSHSLSLSLSLCLSLSLSLFKGFKKVWQLNTTHWIIRYYRKACWQNWPWAPARPANAIKLRGIWSWPLTFVMVRVSWLMLGKRGRAKSFQCIMVIFF